MAGMKTRLFQIKYLISSKAKASIYGIPLFLLVLSIPGSNSAQNRPDGSQAVEQIRTAPISKAASATSPSEKVPDAASKPQAGAITDVTITPEDSKATITIVTDRKLTPKEFLLKNPSRLVIDFPNTENKIRSSLLPVRAASINQIRISQLRLIPSPIARIVFEREDGYGAHTITVNKSSVRLVFYKGQQLTSRNTESSSIAKPAVNKTDTDFSSKIPVAHPNHPAPSPEPAKIAAPTTTPLKIEIKPTAHDSMPRSSEAAANSHPPSTNPAVSAPLVATLLPAAIAGPSIAQSSSRFSGQPLTLDLVDTPLVDFFRLLAEEGGVNIVLDPAVKGSISIKVVKLPWDQIFEAALVNNGLDKQVEGTLIRVARKSTLQEEARQEESLKKANLLAADLITRVKRLNYAKSAALGKLLVDQKTARGTVVVDERTNSVILTDLPDSVDKQLQLIETLDIAQPQVEIEARIVSGTRDFARNIGIQFGFVNGNLQRITVGGPNTSGTIGGTRPSTTPNSTFTTGNSTTGRGSSSTTSGSSAAISTGVSASNAGNYNVNLPSARPYGGLGVSIGNIFDTFLLDAAITAGESKGWAKVISQPKITAQNNTVAIITQGLRFPVPVNANNTVTIQFFNAALTLTVTPQITYEGNILLDLKVENNTPDFGRTVADTPSIRTSESTTRVLVSDGGTTLISGILIEDESNTEDKVPGLGSLPIVGNLFRRTSVTKNTQEVLFFITPHIVK
jgi:type IV pilus secretin PilQ/predicted competence protein